MKGKMQKEFDKRYILFSNITQVSIFKKK